MTRTPVYPTVKVEYLASALTWVDLTADVVGDIDWYYGMQGSTVIDRVASTGEMTFKLRNDEGNSQSTAGYYTPNSWPWFTIGLVIRLTLVFMGVPHHKFLGRVSNIKPDSGTFGRRFTEVTVLDWMDYAATFPLQLEQIHYDLRMDEIVPLIVATMPIKPSRMICYRGTEVFPTVFDTIEGGKGGTKALSEFNKLAISELGYIYLRHDAPYGETLVVEGRHTRSYYDSRQTYIAPSATETEMGAEDGNVLGDEAGNSLGLETLQAAVTADFNDSMIDIDSDFGTNMINEVVTLVYPRSVDTSLKVLFSLDYPIPIAAGEVISDIAGQFSDPLGIAEHVAGFNMVDPVGGIDWIAYENPDNTGTDITSNIVAVAAYTSEGVSFTTITNSGTKAGYVTKLQSRGYGVYTYKAIETVSRDATSIATHGLKSTNIDMKYLSNLATAQGLAAALLARNKDPWEQVDGVHFSGNISRENLDAFLYLDIGDLIYIHDTQTTDGQFYINNVTGRVSPGGVLFFSWGLRDDSERDVDYWILGDTEASVLGSTTRLSY